MHPRLPAYLLTLALLATSLWGCGGSSSTTANPPEPPAVGALKPVSAPGELEASIKSGFTTVNAGSETALAASPGDASAGSGNFTGTYTQEANVDEFDAVRYDGERLFVAPRRFPCCYLATDVPVGALH